MSASISPTTRPPTVDLPGPAPVLGFLLVHAALRREVRDLAAAADRGEDVDRRLRLFDRVLRAHHHGEDRVLLPLLRSRQPDIRAVADLVEEQHVRLDETLDATRIHVERHNRCGVATGAHRLVTALDEHLVLEETQLLPLWLMTLSAEEHEAFARRLRRATPWRDIAVMVPWLIDAAPEQYRHLAEAELPGSVRFAYRHWMRGRFERRWRTAAPVAPATLPGSLLCTA